MSDNWPSARRAWFSVSLLFLAYVLSFVDRQILVLMVGPIKRDLGIGDVQFSLLSGLAFTLFYAVLGIPLAWVADRFSRRNLVVVSVLGWGMMTAACGLARGYAGLFLARMGVGIGEAGLSPAAYSMISDSFPPERRGRAIAVYSLGGNTGLAMAFLLGGAIAHWALTSPPVDLGIAAMQGWQLAFLVVSLPSPILALLMLLVREPSRKERAAQPAVGQLSRFLRDNRRLFLLLCLGYSLITVNLAVYFVWTPAFMERRFDWNPSQVGYSFGLILLFCGTAGLLTGGWLADRLTRRGHRDAGLRVVLGAAACALPFSATAPFMPIPALFLALITPMCFFLTMIPGLAVLSFQMIAPNELRGRVVAIYLLIGTLIAFTLAPTIVAGVSAKLLGGEAMIGHAMAFVTALCVPAGILCLWLSRRAGDRG